jgi:hypothetical protein
VHLAASDAPATVKCRAMEPVKKVKILPVLAIYKSAKYFSCVK